jgi:hypothetical protein
MEQGSMTAKEISKKLIHNANRLTPLLFWFAMKHFEQSF